jgi:predicted methyltransferase
MTIPQRLASTMRAIGLSYVPAASLAMAMSMVLLPRAVAEDAIPPYIAAAVADPSRPQTDRQRDADRKPADVVAFAGIEPGDKVADFMPGGGYFTRILCSVVGDAGHVYAISVPRSPPPQTPSPGVTETAASAKPAAEPLSQSCGNVTASTLQNKKRPAPELWSASDDPGEVYEYWSFTSAAELFAAPEPLDAIWTSENYHDLHNKRFGSPDMLAVDTALFNALKSGGVLIVEDHAGAAGSGARDTETLHRIELAQVKKEVTAAGFVFVAESKVLNNAKDPHTAKAHEMHDRTDRFLLKFRKP